MALRREAVVSSWAAYPLQAALAHLPAFAAVAVPPISQFHVAGPGSPQPPLCKLQSAAPRSSSTWAVGELLARPRRFSCHQAAGLTVTGADCHRQAALAAWRTRFILRLAAKSPSQRLPLSSNVRRLPHPCSMAKAAVVSAVVAAAVTAAAFLLNPSPEQHREKIKEAIAERSPIAGVLGIGALTAFTSTYHPLGVASYTTVNERTVSLGVLGMVFVLQPKQDK